MFAILKSYVHFLYEKKPVYSIVEDPLREPKEISKKEALEIIRENGFILVYDNDNGKIWESPDKEWSKKYKGVFAREAQKKRELAEQRKREQEIAQLGLNSITDEQNTENANGTSSDAVAD